MGLVRAFDNAGTCQADGGIEPARILEAAVERDAGLDSTQAISELLLKKRDRFRASEDAQPILNVAAALDFSRSNRVGTAAGEALIAALVRWSPDTRGRPSELGASTPGNAGRLSPAATVLLSDGDRTQGQPVKDAAETIATRGVPVFPIVFGTDSKETHRAAMAGVAQITGGTSFEASSRQELSAVYEGLSGTVGFQEKREQLGGPIIGGALLLIAVAMLSRNV